MKLNFLSPLCKDTSYGITGLNIAYVLSELGVDLSLFPIGQVSLDPSQPYMLEPIKEGLQRGLKGYSNTSPCIRLYHQFDLREFVGNGPHLGWPIFELNHFKDIEFHQLSQLDHIIVCSDWASSIIKSEIQDIQYESYVHAKGYYGVETKCHIVPLGHDPKIFKETPLNTSKETVFLVIGKTEHRKSSLEIVQAFNKAFSKDDNVKLKLAWTCIFNSKEEQTEWDRFAKNSKLGEKIEIVPRVQSCAEVAKLIESSDCLVSMSKAEGFNLPALEALACGRHVIATNNTAQTQFLNNENAFLIETPNKCIAADGKWFKDDGFGCEWHSVGEKEIGQLVEFYRTIHDCKQTGTLGINKLGIETAKRFTWENSAKKLLEILKQLI